jgi:hypothetical protein
MRFHPFGKLASALIVTFVTIVIQYGQNQQMALTGPPDDTYCAARREAIEYNATSITIPTGTYRALCPDTTKIVWPATAKLTINGISTGAMPAK